MIALLAMLALLPAAPRTPYGGNAVMFVYGAPLSLDPRAVSTQADATLSALLFEPLYTLDRDNNLVPVLARAQPELRGNTLYVPLRTDVVFHDQKPLTASAVAQHFLSLADERSNASFVIAPLRGGLARLSGDTSAKLGITARDDEAAIVFELLQPYEHYARLLASPRAAITGAGRGSKEDAFGLRAAGTGPFFADNTQRSGNESLTLAPFRAHVLGRPFLDAIQVRVAVSRFGTISLLRKNDAAIVFGVPDVRAAKHHTIVPWDKRRLPSELTVLAIGDGIGELATADGRRAIELALDRTTLARRFLGNGAEPASTLFGELEPSPARDAAARERAGLRAVMLVAQGDHEARRVADRLQLDLLHAGITVIIEKVPAGILEARRRDRRYDLMVDTVYADGQPGGAAIDRFHALLSIAAQRGLPTALAADELSAFLRAGDDARKSELIALEREVRLRAGVVPIAARIPLIAVNKSLEDWSLSELGIIELSGAYFSGASGAE